MVAVIANGLSELQLAADKDLRAPTRDAHLRWIFWHAAAVGVLEAARIALKHLHDQDNMSLSLQMTTLSDPVKAAFAGHAPQAATLRLAEETLVEAAACVEATSQVSALLDRVVSRAKVGPGDGAAPASQRVGQVSHSESNQPSRTPAARSSMTARPAAPNGQPGRGK
jgi:hypothetical protein